MLALPLLAFDITMPETPGLLLAMLSGAVTSGLGYVIWNRVSPSLGLATLATVQLATPLVAALGGIALLDELVTSELIVAGVLIVTGIGLTLRR
jgi:drug/metabolite transporter (DMT)-like permease